VIKETVRRALAPRGSSRCPARGTAGLHSLSTTPTLVRADLRGQESWELLSLMYEVGVAASHPGPCGLRALTYRKRKE
jgi:hypothetical protein